MVSVLCTNHFRVLLHRFEVITYIQLAARRLVTIICFTPSRIGSMAFLLFQPLIRHSSESVSFVASIWRVGSIMRELSVSHDYIYIQMSSTFRNECVLQRSFSGDRSWTSGT